VGLDIALALVLARPFGLPGVAGAIAVGAWVETAILSVLLARRLDAPALVGVARSLVLAAIVTAPGVLVAWLLERALVEAWGPAPGFLPLLLRIVLVTVAGGLVVLAGAAALRIPELPAMLSVMTDLVRRRGRP
jgi:peptidoglycan biosynthesis protein MviN/MurJ (putative lipid II flippase)